MKEGSFTGYKILIPIILGVLIFLCVRSLVINYKIIDIDVSKYEEVVASSDKSMVFIVSDDCLECDKAKDLLKKMLQGSKIKTYMINVDNLDDDEKLTFMSKFEETANGVYAPSVLLVSSNELKDKFYGPFDEDLVLKFLQDNELVKKVKIDSSETNE